MGGHISILMYHQVGKFAPMREHRSTYCDHRRFAAQMALLHHLRYRVLRLNEALRCLVDKEPVPARAVVLTFDDGYENFYEYAYPVLQRYRFPAIVYLISDLVGKASSWFARDGRDTPMLMDARRIRQLHAAGIDFGAHSASHVRLAEQSTERVREEVFGSKRALEDLLGSAVLDFCYPYGSHDMRAVDLVAEAGYRSGVTCERAAASDRDDPLTLPRKAISYGDNLAGFLWKLHTHHEPRKPALRRAAYSLAA
jgi:peptidoglycan/xylan/chitin deacetylase (PgdA/CDA1 family)